MKFLSVLSLLVFASPVMAADFPKSVVLKVGSAQTTSVQAKLAELMVEHLPKYLPGAPTITAEFVPGAAGVQLARQMVESEPTDGSIFAALTLVASRSFVLDPEGLGFDPTGIAWIGALSRPVWVCSAPKDLPVVLGETDLIFGATTKRDATYVMPALIRDVLAPGKVSIVVGFKTPLEKYAAEDRGEINANCNGHSSFQRDMRGEVEKIFATFGTLPEAGPDVLNVLDKLTDLDRQAIAIASAVNQPFNTYAMPPGTPPEILELYRQAFEGLKQDPDFLLEVKKLLPEYAPTSGPDLQAFVDGLKNAAPEVIARARQMQQ